MLRPYGSGVNQDGENRRHDTDLVEITLDM